MSYKIITKYIKDINFNIPNVKAYFLIEKDIKNYKINFDIKSKKIKEDIFEIDINLKLISGSKDDTQVKVSILYSTLINIEKSMQEKNKIKKIILVDIPSSVYPDIRNLLIFLFEKSGFKKINIDEKIDFKNLYEKNN
tara:strand:+ start:294 stop:707 length:414 start_codon:yes stop_codon:yes gene_type:complete